MTLKEKERRSNRDSDPPAATPFTVDERSVLSNNLKKYFNYFFESKGFTSDTVSEGASVRALDAAKAIRGSESGPALMIHGIMPRSGTVYAGELLRRHPDLYAYPYQLWEFPALERTADLLKLQKQFILGYRLNQGKLASEDFLPLFGAALLAYLSQDAPPYGRLLVKIPSVQYLSHFFTMFPHEHLLVLVRDGRDVVHSTLRTWPRLNFIQVCLRWNRSARAVIETMQKFSQSTSNGYWLVRYEDLLHDPAGFVTEACRRFDMDEKSYPYEEINKIKVIGSSSLTEEDTEVKWEHRQRPSNFRPKGYWQEWDGVKKAIFKVIAGRSLINLGYCNDLNW